MSIPVLVAVPGPAEAALVAGWATCRRDVVVARRCADLADLLAAAGAGLGRVALVAADVRGLDADAVAALVAGGLTVVGLHPAGEEAEERRLRQIGIARTAPDDSDPRAVAALVLQAVEAPAGVGSASRWTGAAQADPAARTAPAPASLPPFRSGRVLAVWGAWGSTGRTTVAVNLAAELAAAGRSVLLVDADTYGASVAQVLGLLDEAPSLLAAARAASDGRWDVAALHATAPEVSAGLRVLTGAVNPRRWPELRPAALAQVLEVARAGADWTVVDVAACPEHDEDGVRDMPALRRNAATACALAAADVVAVVGASDPVGLQRLIRSWLDLPELAPQAVGFAVANRLRASAVGRAPARRVCDALARFAGVEDPVLLPEDREACDGALLAGRILLESAPRSTLRLSLRDLARRLPDIAGPQAPVAEGSTAPQSLSARRHH
ncbi:MinD-like ATPase involved in chromosome partitioning or flagellar assembly [Kineococcus xinjiangensis]|uniref:MinD-like ATPase involved in chromosome partitioning or flagellar assembly n=1 Tax=Kineococcus xinjiangensis TaxID=512762 RepID=A0A2S6IU96_9ACTN|nr:P-loop NTPase [Kineococcus xinjiangensis]PPK97832.1 MinD-like ATPase involved in chromosome partitioning or flagellar assembly [Kineococcus xinjiangensis]